jgi:hypothetical protein
MIPYERFIRSSCRLRQLALGIVCPFSRSDRDALISTKRAGAAGDRELSFKGDKWKTMIRLGMPLAKLRGDTNRFENVSARQVGGDVVITAQRYSVLKAYWSPFTLVLRKRPDAWRIVEERSETRP